jgi:hypothetical protein
MIHSLSHGLFLLSMVEALESALVQEQLPSDALMMPIVTTLHLEWHSVSVPLSISLSQSHLYLVRYQWASACQRSRESELQSCVLPILVAGHHVVLTCCIPQSHHIIEVIEVAVAVCHSVK